MFRNYLRISFRSLWRHRVYSTLNILGLTIGMSAAFLIFLYVRLELSYDQWHPKTERIYRLVCDNRTPSGIMNLSIVSAPMPLRAKEEFPEIESFVRIAPCNMLVRRDNIKFQESNMAFADSSLFTVFDLPLKLGDARTVLRDPQSVVLSESTARKYFGNGNPIGQTLLLTNKGLTARVTGVMKDLPENTQLKADIFLSRASLMANSPDVDKNWFDFGPGITSYLLLKPGTDAGRLEKKFPAFIEKAIGPQEKELQLYYTLFLEPMKDVYLRSRRDGSPNIVNVYVFSIIGTFLLLLAGINFVNLTTARATERAKEVGVRKVTGAGRGQLVMQFLGESLLQALLAFLLAAALCEGLIAPFNYLAGKTVSTGLFEHPGYVFSLLGIAVGVGLLAGVYPALVLSSFQPVVVLKGRYATGAKGSLLRKGLVISQFTISIALIVGTMVVYAQLNHMRSQDLGFNGRQMLVLDMHGDDRRWMLKDDLHRIPGVISTAMSSSIPGGSLLYTLSEAEDPKGVMQTSNINLYFVDYDYIPQYGIKVIAGRAFSRDHATDTSLGVVLNESAVKQLGYARPEAAIGRRFRLGNDYRIMGVIKDFHYLSLQSGIAPLCMALQSEGSDQLSIKVKTDHLPATLAAIEAEWKKAMPYRPFSYYFLDESFDQKYRAEDRFGRLFFYFSVLTMLISCLGLLGLASYNTLQRTKEIGIRKVLGASVRGIVQLLSKEFMQLVGIAFLIATPLSWYFMQQWLNGFYYRIAMHWWIFGLTGALALVVALLTIGLQAVRAAVMNPVKSLRAE